MRASDLTRFPGKVGETIDSTEDGAAGSVAARLAPRVTLVKLSML